MYLYRILVTTLLHLAVVAQGTNSTPDTYVFAVHEESYVLTVEDQENGPQRTISSIENG